MQVISYLKWYIFVKKKYRDLDDLVVKNANQKRILFLQDVENKI